VILGKQEGIGRSFAAKDWADCFVFSSDNLFEMDSSNNGTGRDHEFHNHRLHVLCSEKHEVIEAFIPNCPNKSFYIGIAIGTLGGKSSRSQLHPISKPR
jgi:hypothetical protein